MNRLSKIKTKPAAASKKAAAAAGEKRPQHLWLRDLARQLPPLSDEPPAAERMPLLLDKAKILTITGASYPTVWAWMRDGKFPRSRVVGGKSMWVSTEIVAWMAKLPVRRLKGDKPEAASRLNVGGTR
jgi:predicted DNA-binding transcriptional regulator AlpA